jgi:beta-glucosidase/6-phospho-beta-glucosidase/beta-galactosidase
VSVGRRTFLGAAAASVATQKRRAKDSARWYREVIASNGARL